MKRLNRDGQVVRNRSWRRKHKPRHYIEQSRRLRVAWHEAAHAVVAHMQSNRAVNTVEMIDISKRDRRYWKQKCNLFDAGLEGNCRIEGAYVTDEDIIDAAGVAGELLLPGETNSAWGAMDDGAAGDIERYQRRNGLSEMEAWESFERLAWKAYLQLLPHKNSVRKLAKHLLRKRYVWNNYSDTRSSGLKRALKDVPTVEEQAIVRFS